MDEQETTTQDTQETTNEDSNNGLSVIEKAELTARKANEAADRLKAENDRMESLLAKQALGGRSSAGMGSEKKEPEMSDEEYSKAALEGRI